jgi:hypothetical protein
LQAPRKQFLAPAIINCIAAFFFAKRGLAHGDDTKKYFKPLTGQLVVLLRQRLAISFKRQVRALTISTNLRGLDQEVSLLL